MKQASTRPFPSAGTYDNYGILGSITTTPEIADIAGAVFVGKGCGIANDGRTLISGDKLRQYRLASYITRTGYRQANFEKALIPNARNKCVSNGHLNIIP